jgi:hypothetical protein
MIISLSKEGIESNNTTLGEVLVLIAVENKVNLEEAQNILITNGYLTAAYDKEFNKVGYRLTSHGKDLLNNVIVDSEKEQKPKDKLEALATALKEIFPKGKKGGTNYYWTDGVPLIVRRLKLFFKKYGNSYSDDQLITATKKYVNSFNGDYHYMKLLKYFIFKEKTNSNGEIEGESDLLNYLENADQDDLGIENNSDWTTSLK